MKRRSQRRSSTSGRLEPVFFVDADLCSKVFLATLRQAGLALESHHDHFREGTPDEVWLEHIGSRGWIALSRNKEIRRNSFETDRLMQFGTRVFMLIGNPNPHLDFMRSLAENFVNTIHKVHRFLEKHDGPFIAKVSRPDQAPDNPHSQIVRPGNVEMWLSYEQWLSDRQRREGK